MKIKIIGLLGFLFLYINSVISQISKDQLLDHLQTLSSDEFNGRRTGDNEEARTYILKQISDMQPAYPEFVDTFKFLDRLRKPHTGYNIVTSVEGSKFPDYYIVVSAHYDHLGVREDKIYNGADDNASGTAALIELAGYFKNHPPKHTMVFAFFDAEEMGLKGADRFVEDPPFERDRILLNINMDMVSRNEDNAINICGTYNFPKLSGPLKKVVKNTDLNITKLHEGPEATGADNWTTSSDHGMFLKKNIPYLYFGVEDHPGYHNPEDDFEFVNQEFYHRVTGLVLTTCARFDKKLKKRRKV